MNFVQRYICKLNCFIMRPILKFQGKLAKFVDVEIGEAIASDEYYRAGVRYAENIPYPPMSLKELKNYFPLVKKNLEELNETLANIIMEKRAARTNLEKLADAAIDYIDSYR